MKGAISIEMYEIDPVPVNLPIIRTIDAGGDISYKADLATFEGSVDVTKHTTSFSGAIQYFPLDEIHILPNDSAEKWYNYLQKEYDKNYKIL